MAELTTHCTDVQMLKFGQVIDVSMLDSIGLRNKGADELRQILKNQVSLAPGTVETVCQVKPKCLN